MDGGGGDMDMGGMSMSMTFQPFSSYQLQLIWGWWDVQSKGQYAGTLLAVFLAVVAYRYLVRLELALARRTAAGGAGVVVGGGGLVGNAELGESLLQQAAGHHGNGAGGKGLLLSRVPWGRRLVHAVLSGLLYAYALLLMLAAMSYNPGVFVALVVGYVVGELAFGASLVAGGVAAAQAKGSACCD